MVEWRKNYEKIYLNNQLCVNRKYQRKLVWGLEDKVLGNMRPVRCSDKIVILFTARATREVYYDRELYVRHNSHNTPVEFDSQQQHEIADKFSKVREKVVREIAETKKNESEETTVMGMF